MRTQTYAERKLAQKAGMGRSNSNVQRYIYTDARKVTAEWMKFV